MKKYLPLLLIAFLILPLAIIAQEKKEEPKKELKDMTPVEALQILHNHVEGILLDGPNRRIATHCTEVLVGVINENNTMKKVILRNKKLKKLFDEELAKYQEELKKKKE